MLLLQYEPRLLNVLFSYMPSQNCITEPLAEVEGCYDLDYGHPNTIWLSCEFEQTFFFLLAV